MRKEKRIVLNDRGRELKFKIKEMSALQLERWIVKAGLLLAGSGILDATMASGDAGDVIAKAGKVISNEGLSALTKLDFDKAEPLLDDLLGCCSHIAEGGVETRLTSGIVDGIVEDVRTLFQLRKEALALNLGFFVNAGQSDFENSGTPSPARSARKISVRSQDLS